MSSATRPRDFIDRFITLENVVREIEVGARPVGGDNVANAVTDWVVLNNSGDTHFISPAPLSYRMVGGIVVFKGYVEGSSDALFPLNNTRLLNAVIPSDFRPVAQVDALAASDATPWANRIVIGTDGSVNLTRYAGRRTYFSGVGYVTG